MMPPNERLEEIFVVRIWREAGESDVPWRGRAEHVRSAKVRYFSNFGDLCEFIASQERGPPADSAVAGWTVFGRDGDTL